MLLRVWGLKEPLKGQEADRTRGMKTPYFTRTVGYSDFFTTALINY